MNLDLLAFASRQTGDARYLDIAVGDSGLSAAELRKLLDPAALTKGGIHEGSGGSG